MDAVGHAVLRVGRHELVYRMSPAVVAISAPVIFFVLWMLSKRWNDD
jgi:transcription termination factor NusB